MPSTKERDRVRELREELIPAAEDLREKIASLGTNGSTPNPEDQQLVDDLEKLVTDSNRFRAAVETLFSDEIFASGSDFQESMRHARHEARNRLNHLFGTIQLIQMNPGAEELIRQSGTVVESLENCLALVSGAKTDEVREPFEEPLPFTPANLEGQHRGTLLIADDEPENCKLLDRLLTPHGYETEFAANGMEAIERIEERDFDAVLLDIQMPVMDGFEVLSKLRETGQLRHTPVIVVTGLQEEQDAVRCIEIGAEDFLSRPIRPALLMARLNASLEKKRLRERVFEQHFTPELARELARNPDPMKMQARQAEVSVLFCDIRGFSTVSELLGPAQTIDWLSGVMGEFSSIVIEHGGVLVDYTGDELMALWGAPNEQPNHAELACQAAISIMQSLETLNQKWEPVVGARTAVGIGINTGEALVGNVGTHRKFKYGPLGTVVNLASRVQGATKYLKSSLLVTGFTAEQIPEEIRTRRLCQVRVQNIKAPVDLFELKMPDAPDNWADLALSYENALEQFEQKNFRRASSILGDVLLALPNDGPSLQLMRRVVDAMLGDDEQFSPIWDLPGK
ncbi:MAG: response regulator [Verrucomicrobiota bacterium]